MKEAVLLTYMGAPSNLKEIKPFLYRLFSDRDLINFGVPAFLQKPLAYLIATFRTPKVQPQYQAIGGGSPLVRNSLQQAELLAKATGLKVKCGMLYSEPLLEVVAKEIKEEGYKKIYHITLYPQFSYGTVGACIRDVEKQLKGVEVKHCRSWCRNPLYVKWAQEMIRPYLKGLNPNETALLFSAHSLPKYFVEEKRDPYPEEVKESAQLIASAFTGFRWFISYQSKVGPIEWLEPSTEETLRELKEMGFSSVVVFPISFVSEHIETLYELDVEYKEVAKELGIDYRRVRLKHDSPLLIEALKGEVEKLRGE
ncbi:ferrochelatase [Thermovibrio ammonificans HB-1]|uniref:Ferrochelatase n=1 Tax=Thermovibrio ammonificans (strain DSM 15698 / JCM 12110 / HB-1) TaxID=648996 RepID=E8T287_THEA1|nr:ferrochelatase [Thermovibrio ammonificans]ADU96982.1 ferrochelatase [Thermovibrio ammonificans HB-1]